MSYQTDSLANLKTEPHNTYPKTQMRQIYTMCANEEVKIGCCKNNSRTLRIETGRIWFNGKTLLNCLTAINLCIKKIKQLIIK